MKRCILMLLCVILAGTMALTVYAASFQVSQTWDSGILAGGVLDMYAWVDVGDTEDYTYQWQADAGFGSGSWFDLEDSSDAYGYKGTKTFHLQFVTRMTSDYVEGSGWEEIPFRCVVTNKNGESHTTTSMYMHVFSSNDLSDYLKMRGFGLFEPNLNGASALKTSDYVNYTANAEAGAQLEMYCGYYKPSNDPLMNKSNLTADLEIWITENGKTVKKNETATYIPCTVGKDAVTIAYKLHYKLGVNDMGYYETKTVKLTTQAPKTIGTAVSKYDISLLKEMYNESQKLISIPKGVELKVTAVKSNWYQVIFGDYIGYVAKSSVNYNENPAQPLINHVELTAPEPLVGNAPTYACSVNPDTSLATYMEWYDRTDGCFLGSSDRFQAGHSYRLIIWLTARKGYEFFVNPSGEVLTTAVLNGSRPAFTGKAYEQDPSECIEVYYDFVNLKDESEPHHCGPVRVERTEPTCTENGHEVYYHCACGANYADSQGLNKIDIAVWGVIPATGHTSSAWRTTQVYHYSVCTTCGEFLQQEDHYGGAATCTEKGRCAACGYAYLPENENHIPESKWTACAGLYHAHLCTLCGAHCEPEAHIPGPAATETEPQSCTVCGYIITPAKGHTHQLTKVEPVAATCMQEGVVEHYICSGCSQRFFDPAGQNLIPEDTALTLPPLGHNPSDSWNTDGVYHWRSCQVCGVTLEETKMLHEALDGVCVTCGQMVETTEPTQTTTLPQEDPTIPVVTLPGAQDIPTQPSEPAQEQSQQEKKIGWFTAVMIGAVCFGVSVTTTVIILKKKRGAR